MFSNAQLRRLILPLMVQQVLVMLVGMLDTVMVSSAGEAAISGVSIVNEVNYLVIAVMDALATGGSVVVSQYLGYGDRNYTRLSASQLVMISFLIPVMLMMVCLVFNHQILNALYGGIAEDVMANARTYFWITALSFPALGLYNSCNALYRSISRTREIMYVSILMNVINIIGNYIGVYVMHLAAAGVAWPTFISRTVAAVIMLRLCFHHDTEICLNWKDILSWKKDVLQKILHIALPSAVENGLFQLGRVIVTIFVATYGTSQIAANGVANGLGSLTYIGDNAFGLAIMTVVGQCVGADDYKQARTYIKKLVFAAMAAEVIENIIVYFTLPITMRMYTMSADTAATVKNIMFWNAIATSLLHSPSFVLPNALRAAGDVRFSMFTGVLSMFITRIGCSYLLGSVMQMGVLGVWIAMFADWGVRVIAFTLRYLSGKWTRYRIISAQA